MVGYVQNVSCSMYSFAEKLTCRCFFLVVLDYGERIGALQAEERWCDYDGLAKSQPSTQRTKEEGREKAEERRVTDEGQQADSGGNSTSVLNTETNGASNIIVDQERRESADAVLGIEGWAKFDDKFEEYTAAVPSFSSFTDTPRQFNVREGSVESISSDDFFASEPIVQHATPERSYTNGSLYFGSENSLIDLPTNSTSSKDNTGDSGSIDSAFRDLTLDSAGSTPEVGFQSARVVAPSSSEPDLLSTTRSLDSLKYSHQVKRTDEAKDYHNEILALSPSPPPEPPLDLLS